MKNFKFNFERIKTNIKSSKQISFLIFCAIVLLIFTLTWASSVIMSTINYKNYLKKISYNTDETYAKISYSRNYTDDNKINADYVLRAMDYEFKNDYNFALSTITNSAINGKIIQTEISGISENFIDDSFVISKGYPTEIFNDNSVAIKEYIANRFNLGIGDDININGHNFKVAAILDEYKNYNLIFMSIENYKKLFSNITMSLDLFISGLNSGEIKSLTHKLYRMFKSPMLSNIKVESANDRYDVVDSYINRAISEDIIPIVLIFMLSIISIIVLYYGLINWRKINIGIHLSQGATRKNIITDAVLEIFIYVFFSTILSFVFLNIFYNQLSYATSIYNGFYLYLFVISTSFLLAIIVGYFSGKKIVSKPIRELIGG